MRKTQRQAVLEFLRENKTITSMEAFEALGVTRLSAIIFDLRKLGYNIATIDLVAKTRYGTSTVYAQYKLVEEK